MNAPAPRPTTVDVLVHGLSVDQAYALAELCKRIAWRDCRELATSDAEAYDMVHATDQVRRALETVGVHVR